MLKLAIPNKGRLFSKTTAILEEAGFAFDITERCLCAQVDNFDMEILFLRTDDIPVYLDSGIVDIGITGYDLVREHELDLECLLKLGYGGCKMIVAAPAGRYKQVTDLPRPVRVATSFVNIARAFFAEKDIPVEIADIHGAVEISPRLGLADAIVDITSSGATLQQNDLEILDLILTSEACLFANPQAMAARRDDIDLVVRSIRSVQEAHAQKYILVNMPEEKVEAAKAILPGITAPSILPLSGAEKTVAMHSVIHEKDVNRVVRELRNLGGMGILVMNIERLFE